MNAVATFVRRRRGSRLRRLWALLRRALKLDSEHARNSSLVACYL